MSYAPVVLFVYKRKEHFVRTYEALSACAEAKQTRLFIFSDGAKGTGDEAAVQEVRDAVERVRTGDCFESTEVFYAPQNRGLASSIISGVGEVLGKYGKIIVLEDDCVPSPYFLSYMNTCLDKFEREKKIGSVSGFSPRLDFAAYPHDIYITRRSCSWSFATWADRWAQVDWGTQSFYSFCRHPQWVKRLDSGGSDRLIRLYRQTKEAGSSWSIRFGAHHAKNDLWTVYPRYSYIQNIGCDSSGEHSRPEDVASMSVDIARAIEQPCLELPPEDEELMKRFRALYSAGALSDIKRGVFKGMMQLVARLMK